MEEDYEQMNTSLNDNNNPFQKHKRKNYYEIIKNKNKYCKYFIIFTSLLFMIFLSIFLVTKSSQLTVLKEQNNKLKNELNIINSREYNLKEEYSKLNNEKESLTRKNNNLNSENEEFEKKNKKLNEENQLNSQKINSLQNELKEIEKRILEINKKNEDYQNNIIQLSNDNKEYISKIENLKQKILSIEKQIEQTEEEEKKENKINYKNLNSNIIKSQERLNSLVKLLNFENKYNLKLLYQASKDGYSNKKFHEKCDNIKNTITLIEDNNKIIIGGFTSESWNGKGFKYDTKAFIFNLSNMNKYIISDYNKAIYADPDYLTIFGQGDIYMSVNSASSHFPTSYGKGAFNLELTGSEKIVPVEMEVFQILNY